MKIAQMAPLEEAVPPKLYGGTERVVAYLTDALVELGHEVTLFASGDSETKATLVPVWPQALRLDANLKDHYAPVIMQLEAVARRADGFDIIHSHLDYFGFPLLRTLDVPSITTLHGRLDLPELGPLYDLHGNMRVTSISEAQRRPLPRANFIATVAHGLPEHLLQPGTGEGGYVAFLGRISPEKGPDAAISIANRAGVRLKMAAKVAGMDERYFRQTIAPMIGRSQVDFIGEIPERDKESFLGNAAALLFPIAWPEPFGLVLIEAMACGTPVIAYDNGSVCEILEDGVTGFIVSSEKAAVDALQRVKTLDRARIRREFERRFTAHRMAQRYVDLYSTLCRVEQSPQRAAARLGLTTADVFAESTSLLAPSPA